MGQAVLTPEQERVIGTIAAKRIAALPPMLKPVTIAAIQQRFTEAAKKLAPDVFPPAGR